MKAHAQLWLLLSVCGAGVLTLCLAVLAAAWAA